MRNKKEFLPIEEAAALLDVSIKFLKQCIIASIMNFKIEDDEIQLDMSSMDYFINLKEVAKILSVSPRTIRRYSKSKNGKVLRSYRFNKNLVYQLSDVEKFISKSIFKLER